MCGYESAVWLNLRLALWHRDGLMGVAGGTTMDGLDWIDGVGDGDGQGRRLVLRRWRG